MVIHQMLHFVFLGSLLKAKTTPPAPMNARQIADHILPNFVNIQNRPKLDLYWFGATARSWAVLLNVADDCAGWIKRVVCLDESRTVRAFIYIP